MSRFTSQSYPMNVPGLQRGLARIFSHKEYIIRGLRPRKATECDNNRLKSLLENFGFEVKLCQDYRQNQIFNELLEVSKMDHSNYECLALFVMTHGSPGKLYAYDSEYKVSELWSYFTKARCPTLQGKPKLFFIQSCRGDDSDAGFEMRDHNLSENYTMPSPSLNVPDNESIPAEPEHTEEFETPAEPDFLIAYATIPGYYSYNNLETGSWFMQTFCNILEKCGKKYDLLTLLTFIAQKVAIDRQSYSDFLRLHAKKQIPSIVSTLERPLYFFPDEIEDIPEKLELW